MTTRPQVSTSINLNTNPMYIVASNSTSLVFFSTPTCVEKIEFFASTSASLQLAGRDTTNQIFGILCEPHIPTRVVEDRIVLDFLRVSAMADGIVFVYVR